MYEAEDEDAHHVEGEADEEHEEVSVVPPADAVVDPGAVVVEYLDTVVADRTVGTARRPVELTRHAPLHAHLTGHRWESIIKIHQMQLQKKSVP